MGIPPVTAAAELLEAFEGALRDERAARLALRAASERVAQLVGSLQRSGVPTARLAVRVAKVDGLEVTVAARQRIASRLRQRASRVTKRYGNFEFARGDAGAVAVASQETEVVMKSKLIKRTVTEEYIEPAQDTDVETVDEEPDDEADGDDEETDDENSDQVGRPRPRSGRRPR